MTEEPVEPIGNMHTAAEPPMKARLLEAAAQVFGEQGYHAARVSDIVTQAGVAQGTFYLYFTSKAAIFLEMIDGFFHDLLADTLGRHPAAALTGPDDLVSEVGSIWRTLLAYCRARPGLTSLVLRESDTLGPTHRAHIAGHYQRAADSMTVYVREAIARGIIRPIAPDLAAWIIIGMLERAAHYAIDVAPGADIDVLAADLARIELSGLLVDPAAVE